MKYDVLIAGAGCVGSAIAWALAKYDLRVALLDRENDAGTGATRANSAISHAGFDPRPGTLMAKLNVSGSRMMEDVCRRLSVPYRRNGAMVLALSDDDCPRVRALYERGMENGVQPLSLLTGDEARALEPAISPEVRLALHAPGSAIISPWELAIDFADNAVENGVEWFPRHEVTRVEPLADGGWQVEAGGETFSTRYLVNAAGVGSDRISRAAGGLNYTMEPNKGVYYVFDKAAGSTVSHTIFQVPGPEGKGVLVSPTVHGNLIAGPNAVACERDDCSADAGSMEYVRRVAARSVPDLNYRLAIRNFAGVRPNTDLSDFYIAVDRPGFVNLAGIKSPGLTASPAIGVYVAELLGKDGLPLHERTDHISERKRTTFRFLTAEQKAELIRRDPRYGRVICRCETITEGEIVEALHSPTCPPTIDAVKRRCNAGLGRCQGGFCGPRVAELICREKGIDMLRLQKDLDGSFILTEKMQ